MIYVPDKTYKCYVLTNKDTIRAYTTMPYKPGTNQTINISYRDYYINSSYLYTDGVQSFTAYSTLPICLDESLLTDGYYYRNDFDKILTVFVLLMGIILFLFYLCLKSLLRGLFK